MPTSSPWTRPSPGYLVASADRTGLGWFFSRYRSACNDGGVDFEFDNELIEWRGPAPHYFVPVPAERCDELREISHDVTYGWGMVPVVVRIGGSQWETSLWPKDGGYLVPVRAWVRQAESLEQGATVSVGLDVATRDGRQANGQGPTC